MCSLKTAKSPSHAVRSRMDFLSLTNFGASVLESSKLQVTKRIEPTNLTMASVKRVKPEKRFRKFVDLPLSLYETGFPKRNTIKV